MPATKRKMVVAKEAIVINVGARPPVYAEKEVMNRRTGEMGRAVYTELDPVEPGDEGIPYVFKQNQRVPADHPAVKANPSAFVPIDDVDPELVVNG